LNLSSLIRFLLALWGTSGLVWVLYRAVTRLAPISLEAIQGGAMGPGHWVFLVIWTAYMSYTEGWKGFHKRVGPRTASRAFYLAEKRPLRHLIIRWALVTGIITLVVFIRQMPQPWRGIIDAGVVVGLAMGLVSVIYFFFRGLIGDVEELTDLPEWAEQER
jgi:hypothetical protein